MKTVSWVRSWTRYAGRKGLPSSSAMKVKRKAERTDGECFITIYISSSTFCKYHPCKANVVLGHPTFLLPGPTHLLPVHKYSLDQRPCLFICMLLQPSDVFSFLPSVQFVGKRYRRTYNDMVKHNQRRKAIRSLWLCQERIIEEQQWPRRTLK